MSGSCRLMLNRVLPLDGWPPVPLDRPCPLMYAERQCGQLQGGNFATTTDSRTGVSHGFTFNHAGRVNCAQIQHLYSAVHELRRPCHCRIVDPVFAIEAGHHERHPRRAECGPRLGSHSSIGQRRAVPGESCGRTRLPRLGAAWLLGRSFGRDAGFELVRVGVGTVCRSGLFRFSGRIQHCGFLHRATPRILSFR